MYGTGRGVAQDYQEADRWYRNAAERGHAGAQFSLGLMYQEDFIGKMFVKGQGVKKNYLKAHDMMMIANTTFNIQFVRRRFLSVVYRKYIKF